MRQLLLLTIFSIISITLFAQQPGKDKKGTITGKILDAESEEPLGYATVSLLNGKDSSLITGVITDDKGKFLFEIAYDDYLLQIDFLSYQKRIISNIELSEDKPYLNVGKIPMKADAETLVQVEVRAEKSQLQLAMDKKIFNVGKDLANTGGTAADVLDNIPSVTLDVDGNVSLRGSQNVRILVNGRPSNLASSDDAAALRMLQANVLDRVEIITNPSSRYDAEGTAGIINIILKEEKQKGVNGSYDLNIGFPNIYGGAVNMNFRRDKINFFASYGIRYRRNPGGGNTSQQFFPGTDSTYYTDLERSQDRGGLSNNLRLGLDFFADKYTTLTGSFMYRYGVENNNSQIIYRDFDASQSLLSTSLRTDDEREIESNLEYNLNFKRKFDRKGQEWTADVQYRSNRENENSDLIENLVSPDLEPLTGDPLLQRSANQEGESNLLLQTDFVYPFAKEGKFEIGYRGNIREINNDFLSEELNGANEWEKLSNFSNNLIYNENIHAGYVMLGNKQNKFSYQAGLRVEFSGIRTELVETNEVNDRNYNNLFPSANLTYDLARGNAIQASYSRRLRRPRFWDLNPFFTFSDARNIRTGNPNLNPEFTDSYEIGHIKYWDNASMTSAIYYRQTEGVITRITTIDDDGITYSSPVNLASRDAYGLEVTFSADPKKWLRMNGNVNLFRSITEGSYDGEDFSADAFSWTGRINSRFTLAKNTNLQLSFNYRAPQVTAQGRRLAMYFGDLGFSKDILKGNGTLNVNVRDIFNSRRWRYETDIPTLVVNGDFQWRSRTVTLGLNYRLNQNKQSKRGGGDFNGGGDMMF